MPYLILAAAALLAFGDRLKRALGGRRASGGSTGPGPGAAAAIAMAAVCGGYFGAGVSVMILAVLGIVLSDPLSELNALKQAISLACNPSAAAMSAAALAGGVLGGALAGRMKSSALRAVVVIAGLVVGAYCLVRG